MVRLARPARPDERPVEDLAGVSQGELLARGLGVRDRPPRQVDGFGRAPLSLPHRGQRGHDLRPARRGRLALDPLERSHRPPRPPHGADHVARALGDARMEPQQTGGAQVVAGGEPARDRERVVGALELSGPDVGIGLRFPDGRELPGRHFELTRRVERAPVERRRVGERRLLARTVGGEAGIAPCLLVRARVMEMHGQADALIVGFRPEIALQPAAGRGVQLTPHAER